MSTRGVVAVGTLTAWRGVYNHWDSYPTGLGKNLYEHLVREQVQEHKTLAEIGEAILKFDDWRNYLKGGVCEYCGKMTGQPHSISGAVNPDERFKTKQEMRDYFRDLPAWKGRNKDIEKMVEHDWKTRDNITRTGYPDPEAKHHEHNDLTENHYITSSDFDGTWVQWVYVINPDANVVHVIDVYKGKHAKEPSFAAGHVGDMSFDEKPNFTALETEGK